MMSVTKTNELHRADISTSVSACVLWLTNLGSAMGQLKNYHSNLLGSACLKPSTIGGPICLVWIRNYAERTPKYKTSTFHSYRIKYIISTVAIFNLMSNLIRLFYRSAYLGTIISLVNRFCKSYSELKEGIK